MAAWVQTRRARKRHRCGSCDRGIPIGERYLDHVCTPDHDGNGGENWWRIRECRDCAARYGRPITESTAAAPATRTALAVEQRQEVSI